MGKLKRPKMPLRFRKEKYLPVRTFNISLVCVMTFFMEFGEYEEKKSLLYVLRR